MMRVIAQHYETYERTVIALLGACALTLLIAYITFLSVSVFAVVARDQAQRDIEATKIRVAEMEDHYVDMTRALTVEFAHEKGFHDVTEPRYLTTEPAQTAFTMRGQ